MNILFSTTLMWNPGDEIILRGVINLLHQAGLKFNPIAFNRHPAIRPDNTILDNSYDELRHSGDSIDYVVFAGTPEWRGSRVAPLFKLIAESNLRCAFLGIGGWGESITLSPTEKLVFEKHADLICCRDRNSQVEMSRLLPGTEVRAMPCPSIFHSTEPEIRQRTGRIGLNYQTCLTRFQDVTLQERDRIINLIWKLKEKTDITLICNYIDECAEASTLFGSSLVRYSYRMVDYPAFFKEVDCVIGARLHGCLGAMSTGTPAILLGSDTDRRRKEAASLIPVLPLGDLSNLDALMDQLFSIDVPARSAAILDFCNQTRLIYEPLIRGLSCFNQAPEAHILARNPALEASYRESLQLKLKQRYGKTRAGRKLRTISIQLGRKLSSLRNCASTGI